MAEGTNTYAQNSKILKLADFCLDKFATKKTLTDVSGSIPTSTSDLTNNSGFITVDDLSPEGLADNESLSTTITNLINSKVTVPTKVSELENDAEYITEAQLNLTVRDYCESIVVQMDNALDESIAATEAKIPTKTSQLTNDSGYQTASDVTSAVNAAMGNVKVPTKVSELTNDSGYQTAAQVEAAITAKGYLTQAEIQILINTSIAEAVTASINASY